MPLSSGIFEELLFRRAVPHYSKRVGQLISLVVSSLVFGLVHLMNPAATVMAPSSSASKAGVLLAAAYMLTRRLWMSMGFHIAWNYTHRASFRASFRGGYVEPGLIKPVIDGPTLLTGGDFGVESRCRLRAVHGDGARSAGPGNAARPPAFLEALG